MSQIAHPDSSPNPLKALPPELVESAGRFAAFWSESLKGTTALVARLTWWIQEEGLTVAEAKEAMRRMMRPAEAAKHEYSGKAMCALAEAVEVVLTERRKREAEERYRKELEAEKRQPKATAEEIAMLRNSVLDLGHKP